MANMTAPLNLVCDELHASVKQAEACLESYLEDRTNIKYLQSCSTHVHQIHGALTIIELNGASLLTKEIEKLAAAVDEAKPELAEACLKILSESLLCLDRYLSYTQGKQRELTALLIPNINQCRQVLKAPLLPESHVVNIPLSLPRFKTPPKTVDPKQAVELAKKLRQMYQVGLVNVVKGAKVVEGFRYMLKATQGFFNLSQGSVQNSFWWLASIVVECVHEKKMSMTASRRLLFSQLEMLMRQVIAKGPAVFAQPPPKSMLKELLYLLAIADSSNPKAVKARAVFKLVRLPFSYRSLEQEWAVMSGPTGDVLQSVSSALLDELAQIKRSLDMTAWENGASDTDFSAMVDGLKRTISTLNMLGLSDCSETLKEDVQAVVSWHQTAKAGDEIQAEDMQSLSQLANTLLYVEAEVSGLKRPAIGEQENNDKTKLNENEQVDQTIRSAHLSSAKEVVIGEAQAGLSATKRAVVSYMESNWDNSNLSDVPNQLNAVYGGLIFLAQERVAKAVMICLRFIEERLLQLGEQPSTDELDAIADVITCIEYYLEGLIGTKNLADNIIEVAEKSLVHITI